MQANGVFVAPANTATNPMAAISPTGKGMIELNALAKVAPMKKSGVTSPPLNPNPKVKIVSAIFKMKEAGAEGA